MKKVAALISFALLSGSAFAGELIQMRGDLVFQRCEKHSDNSMSCSIPLTNGQPIDITLSTSDGSTIPGGEYKFKSESDGYSFEGTINVSKFTSGQYVRYLIQTWVASIKGNDLNTFNLDYLGSASVSDIGKLNEISFDGAKSIAIGDVTLSPKMIVGPKDGDLSFLSQVQRRH
jgi:hypothetical protein